MNKSNLNRCQKKMLGRFIGALFLFSLSFGIAYSQTSLNYKDLVDFDGSNGANPVSGVTFDIQGNVYGTAEIGGANNLGLIWEITAAGQYKDIHDFGGTVINAEGSSGPDGFQPMSGLSFDGNGNMYGVTFYGGSKGAQYGNGIVWEIMSGGQYKDLHDFGGTTTLHDGGIGPDGFNPECDVSFDGQGNIYGTTSSGGQSNFGMVWEITSGGDYNDLHDFGGTIVNADGSNGPDGEYPYAGITFDSSGDMFGTTEYGGPNDMYESIGAGIVWEITSGGAYRDLHDFGGSVVNTGGKSGPDGTKPGSGVTLDSAGDLFGVAQMTGPNDGGTVWEITKGGAYKDLHDFGGTVTNANGTTGLDGLYPLGTIEFDSSGNLYGTTLEGGPNDPGGNIDGMVWEIVSGGTYKDLHDFGGTITDAEGASRVDGLQPSSGVAIDTSGNLYGTAELGAPFHDGLIWALKHPERVTGLTLSPTTIGGLGTTTGTVTLAVPAPSGGWPVTLHAGASGYLNLPSSVTVPAGATTATFTITGTAQRPSTIDMGIFANDSVGTVEAVLTIQGDSLKSFSLSPSQIKWTSGASNATLTIVSAAPPGGWIVKLTPGVAGYVNLPTTVTVPAGSTSTTFAITGNALRFFTLNLGITASDGASKATATLTIAGDAVKSISLSPSTIEWGGTSTATVNLVVAAPPGGWLVNTNPGAVGYVSMPTSITVPAGATSATLTITAGSQRSSNLTIGIYANDGPSNQSATLKIEGDSVKSLTLSPTTITALGSSTATVTLASAAPPGGWKLTLHPGASGFVSMPTTLTVPAGATSATFTVTGIAPHSSTVNLGIFVSDGNSTQEAILTIT